MRKLANKVAVVMGASKGIGAAIARHLAQESASVVVNYLSSKEGADKVVSEIAAAGGQAIAVGADVSSESGITALFERTKAVYGQVDILVNNAGVYAFGPLESVSPAAWHREIHSQCAGITAHDEGRPFPLPGSGREHYQHRLAREHRGTCWRLRLCRE